MEIGQILEIDGIKRRVIDFSIINGISYPNTEPYKEDLDDEETDGEYKCQYCGKVCKNALGLASHERNCKENPENKEVTDGNN